MKIAHKLILSFLPLALLACALIALGVSSIASDRATLIALGLLTLATVALTAAASMRILLAVCRRAGLASSSNPKWSARFRLEEDASPALIAEPLQVGNAVMTAVSRHIGELKPDAERIGSGERGEKDLLLKEVYHRVNNNMQVIISMLSLQSRPISDPLLRAALQDSQERIRSMAMVHEQLYESPDLASISFGSYARNLTSSLFSCYADGLGQVRIQVSAEDVSLDLDSAIPCGLIVNELVSNALKHAFPGGRDGEIRVLMAARDGSLCLQVLDDGVGLPPSVGDWRQSPTLGLQIVASMTAQLDGEICLSTEPGAGTRWQITFAASKKS